MKVTDTKATSDVTIDIVATGTTTYLLNSPEESEIAVLFETMLHFAGLSGRHTVRMEEHIRGAVERRNTVKFQLVPLGGVDFLRVTWQTTALNSACKGILVSNELSAREVATRLGERYPSLVFDLSRDAKVDDTSPGAIFADRKKFRRLAKDICQRAEQDPDTFITRDALVAIIKPVFPKVSFGPGNRVTVMFEQQGYLSAFDESKESGGQRRFFVEPALFDVAGLIHPDKRPKVESKPTPPKPRVLDTSPLDTMPSATRGMVPNGHAYTAPRTVTPLIAPTKPAVGALGSLLAEIKELKQKATAAAELQASIDKMEKEQTELRSSMELAKSMFEEAQRNYNKEKAIAEAALTAKQVWIDQKKRELNALGDAKQALADLAELKSLLP